VNKKVITNSLYAVFLASRPKTLSAIVCPVLIGSSFAVIKGLFSFNIFVLTLLCALALQALSNFINDYGDFIKGADTAKRLGPPRAMQMGWLCEKTIKKVIVVTLLFIIGLGFPLVIRGGLLILIVGILSIACCAWYTLGKKPLSYLGFAEIIVFLMFGPLSVLGSYYVQTLSFSIEPIVVSFAPGFLSAALLLANNLRDAEEDQKHFKNTLAVRFGEQFARLGIVILITLVFTVPLILSIAFSYSPAVLLSCIPLIIPLTKFPMILFDPISAKFNDVLASIGQTLLLFGICLSLGIIYGAI
jgi:1,4-dihydroxy-2-naphthoate polyprenyltransferase